MDPCMDDEIIRYGPIFENGECRIRCKQDLKELYQNPIDLSYTSEMGRSFVTLVAKQACQKSIL
uniref:Uncharacterized protein n=1 Tax=Megaselia scalaris TaxID=36166 RepID=T1GCN4_MEGSC